MFEPAPVPSGSVAAQLAGVSCAAGGSCVAWLYTAADRTGYALGDVRDTVTSAWELSAVPTPARSTGASLAGVSCAAAETCTAVGGTSVGPLVERWNGRRWAAQDPQANRRSGFTAVSCPVRHGCTAAGYNAVFQHYPRALVDTWDGTTWQPAIAPGLPAATESESLAVSCSDAAACTSVGFNTDPFERSAPLIERWNGRQWAIQTTPGLPSSNTVLDGVSCPSATSCVAVGYYYVSDGMDAPLTETWNGHVWRIRHIQAPPGRPSSELRAVSCSSAQACIAVGGYTDGTGNQTAFAERWDGSTWQFQHVAVPVGATGSLLVGVSCSEARACTAVGNYSDRRGRQRPLAATSNATGWRLNSVPAPAGSLAEALTSVTCSARTACTAVGSYIDSVGDTDTLVEARAGGAWSVQHSPNQPGAVSTSLAGVSCQSDTSCAAVGSYFVLGPNGHPLPPVAVALAWNGTAWRLRSVSAPAGANSSVLNGVSCATGRCHGVGYVFGSSGHQVTYAAGTAMAAGRTRPVSR